jgi:EmrB/QacA subfamily drug resistance transporter
MNVARGTSTYGNLTQAELPEFIVTQIPRWSAAGQLSRARRLIILATCCQALLIIGIDNTIVNVALPSIGRDLHASVSGLQWTMSAYTIVLASFMLLAGSIGDRFGRRAIFQAGLAMFTLGSWLCSLAPDLHWLIAFRVLQGLGGSMLNPVAASIVATTFTDKAERARALGIWSGVFGISMALGPVAGGLLTASVGWRGIFWVNIPVGLAGVALAAILIPESRVVQPRRLDPVGQMLIIVILGALTYTIIEGPSAGWRSAKIEGVAVLVIVALATLLRYEARRRQPLIDTRLFLSAPFSGAILVSIASFTALGGFLFLATMYLQDVAGLSPVQTGLRILPTAAGIAVCAPVAGWIMARRGPRVPLVIAGICITLGSAAVARVSGGFPDGYLAVAFEVFGIGIGMVNPVVTNVAVSGMPRAQLGVATGIASASRQVGQTLGVAIAGSILAGSLSGSMRTEFTHASHGAWWLLAGCGYLVLVLAFVATSKWASWTASKTAITFGPAVDRRQNARDTSR